MTINWDALRSSISILYHEQKARKTAKYSTVAGIACAGTAVATGMVLGPFGVFLGSSLAGYASYRLTKGKFQSFYEIVRDISPKQQEILKNHLHTAFKDLDMSDLVLLLDVLEGRMDTLTLLLKLNQFYNGISPKPEMNESDRRQRKATPKLGSGGQTFGPLGSSTGRLPQLGPLNSFDSEQLGKMSRGYELTKN